VPLKNNAPSRVFFLFDQGLASSMAGELLFLFAHAGFEIRCGYTPGAERWLPPEPIRALTGHDPFPFGQVPVWPGGSSADLAIGLLQSPRPWLEEYFHSSAKPGMAELEKCPWFFLTPGDLAEGSVAALKSAPGFLGMSAVPSDAGMLGEFFEGVFSHAIRFFQARTQVAGKTFSGVHQIPEEFRGVSDRPPGWVEELDRQFRLHGFSPSKPATEADLIVRTFSGPFPVKGKKGGAIGLSFEIKNYPPPPDRGRCVQFYHVDTPASKLKGIANERFVPVIRSGQGDMHVFTQEGERLFPDLTQAPAAQRLVEFLIA